MEMEGKGMTETELAEATIHVNPVSPKSTPQLDEELVADDSPAQQTGRTLAINAPAPTDHKNRPIQHCSNKIRTSKYTVLNFIPKTLFEQFRRFANIYFLWIGCLQTLPATSTTNGVPTIALPLVFVLTVSAVKELIEDCRRHSKDAETNNRTTLRWDGGCNRWVPTLWKNVCVGDICKAVAGDEFAADMVVLGSADKATGVALVQTANLDGETNLKRRVAIPSCRKAMAAGGVGGLKAVIQAEEVSKVMHSFDGNMTHQHGAEQLSQCRPLTIDNLLMRGAKLMNTEWAVGVVVYTGHETRVMMNAGSAPSKMSKVEGITNQLLVGVFVMQAVLCFVQGVLCGVWHQQNGSEVWYIDLEGSAIEDGIKRYFTYMILLTQLIPISLYVTVEIVKFLQLFLMQADEQMYYAPTDKAMECRTSNLNEELGMIDFVFSDKTGTLTQNCMDLAYVWVDGTSYGPALTEGATTRIVPMLHTKLRDDRLLQKIEDGHADSCRMLHMMAMCNTVVPASSRADVCDEALFEAESPDEQAFVWGAKSLGAQLTARETSQDPAEPTQLVLNGGQTKWQLLYTLEFSSTRARMSVVVRDPETGEIELWCKGSDAKILSLLDSSSKTNATRASEVVSVTEHYANLGLRTLCWGYRKLDAEWFAGWAKEMDAAQATISDRSSAIAHAADKIEQRLELLGVSAVEDLLQQGVPQTIANLRQRAGIKLWVLTGDKQGTAIQIAQQCNLITTGMQLIKVNLPVGSHKQSALHNAETLQQLMSQKAALVHSEHGAAVIVDGVALQMLLDGTDDDWMQFQELACSCSSVVVCRVSPDQKAQVCNRVKDRHPQKPRCLSIGDGANDVPMIQAAHIGVGIAGVEGMQAVQASDYAIAQFRFLERLLLVHGRWSYLRVTMVITYSFYKNITFVLAQYWWGFQTASSGQKFYTEVGYQMFNVMFSSLPVIIYGLWEQDVNAEISMKNPELYQVGRGDMLFNGRTFSRWILNALWHSVVLSLLPTFITAQLTNDDGVVLEGTWMLGNTVFTCVILVINAKLMLETRYWIWVHWLCFGLMISAWFGFVFLASKVQFPLLTDGMVDYGVAPMMYAAAAVWVTVVLTVCTALLPDMVWTVWWFSTGLQSGLALRLKKEAIQDGLQDQGCHCGCCCCSCCLQYKMCRCADGCVDRCKDVEEQDNELYNHQTPPSVHFQVVHPPAAPESAATTTTLPTAPAAASSSSSETSVEYTLSAGDVIKPQLSCGASGQTRSARHEIETRCDQPHLSLGEAVKSRRRRKKEEMKEGHTNGESTSATHGKVVLAHRLTVI